MWTPTQALDFGQLRSILCNTPSAKTWLTIWSALVSAHDSQPNLACELWVPYIETHVDHWPHGARAITMSTLRHQLLVHTPLVRCVDTLIFESPEDIQALLRIQRTFDNIRGASFRGSASFTRPLVSLLTTRFPYLESLSFDHVNVGGLGWRRFISKSDHLPHLVHLRVRAGRLCDEDMHNIIVSEVWPGLEALQLPDNHIRYRGLHGLLERRPTLTHLDLSTNPIWNEGLAILFADAPPCRLRQLGLRETYLDDQGADLLAASTSMHQLGALDLSFNDLTDEGARVLAESVNLGRLHTLELRSNRLSAGGVKHLRNSPYLTTLEHLDVRDNHSYRVF